MTVDEIKKAIQEPLFDSGILRHGFAPFLRDYDLVAQINQFQYLYRFTHCVLAIVATAVEDRLWKESWDDIFTDRIAHEQAGSPEGYVWGVCYSLAYPGATYIENSVCAQDWSRRLGKPMHEVLIETNGHNLDLIFHDLIVRELTESDEEWVK